jgi:hypothetical protein
VAVGARVPLKCLVVLAGCGRIGFAPQDARTTSPLVHAGSCSMDLGATSVSCPIAPALISLDDSVLFFQATGNDLTPATEDVRCQLSSTASVTCDRWGPSTGAESAVSIQWQTLEHPAVHAQHLDFTCSMLATFPQAIAPVSPGDAFVLHSLVSPGAYLNDDDFITVELVSATEVDAVIGSTDTCGADGIGPMLGEIDAVEVAGASVTRGIAGPMNGTTLVVSGLSPVDPASSLLLFSYRSASNNTALGICELMVRGELTSPTTLSFSRALGDTTGTCTTIPIEAISWERVDLGALATVQPFTAMMFATATTATVPISTVDPSRALAFSSAQGLSGVGTGEGLYSGGNLLGEIDATFSLAPDSVTLTRGTAFDSAAFSGYVVEWK